MTKSHNASLFTAQVFMLSIPPRLAVAWFPEREINVATSIAVSANNLGIAAGCALTPLMVNQATSKADIPDLLLFQVLDQLFVFTITIDKFMSSS